MEKLKYFDEITCPKIVNGDLNLKSIKILNNVFLPDVVKGRLTLGVKKLENYILPKKIRFLVLYNTGELKNINLSSVYDSIDLRSVIKIENVIFPNEISGDLYLNSLASAKGINLPNKVGGDLCLNTLNSTKGIELPNDVENLYLNNLLDAKNLKLPKNIKNYVFLNSLTKSDLNLENLPDELNYSIYFKDGILTPQNFKEWKKECNYRK